MLESHGKPDIDRAVPLAAHLFRSQLIKAMSSAQLTDIGEWVVGLFMDYVEPIPLAGCWIWTGRIDGNGYGNAVIASKSFGAHKLAYLLFIGPIGDKQVVCHRCDVPLCVNSAHLFLGTHADNMRDAFAKNRLKPPPPGRPGLGEDSPRAILRDADVAAIRASTLSDGQLGKRYGVDRKTIAAVRRRKTWKHLP